MSLSAPGTPTAAQVAAAAAAKERAAAAAANTVAAAVVAHPDQSYNVTTLGLEHTLAIPIAGPIGVGYLGGAGLYYDTQTGLGAYYVVGYGLTVGIEGGLSGELGRYPSLDDLFGKGAELGFAAGALLNLGLNFSFDPDANMHPAGHAYDVGVGDGLAGYAFKSHTGPVGVPLLPPLNLPDLQDVPDVLARLMGLEIPFFGGP